MPSYGIQSIYLFWCMHIAFSFFPPNNPVLDFKAAAMLDPVFLPKEGLNSLLAVEAWVGPKD